MVSSTYRFPSPITGHLMKYALLLACTILMIGKTPLSAQNEKLELKPRDRVCFVGETLAEREGLFGYFEALLQARFPTHHLTFRNLAFSGDTPEWLLQDLAKGESAIRALNFGGIDKYLSETKADVIFLCFGMNDSFRG